jgi:Flp pilus assembly protein TadD
MKKVRSGQALRRPAFVELVARPPVAALVLLGACLLAYANSFHCQFVFDDWSSIRDNVVVRDLSNWVPGALGYAKNPNRYIGNLTFALNYAVGGLSVTGYHVVNLAIHLANALLVYALVVLTFRTPRLAGSELASASRQIALAAALLFATHPIQSQAVTYVVQRLASLATLFYVLTVVLYARWRLADRERPAWARAASYLPIVLSAVLAMKTKEISFTLPAALALYELCFLEGRPARRIAFLLPIAAASLLIPLAILDIGKPVGEVLSSAQEVTKVATPVTRWDYLTTQLAVIVTYLRLILLPVGQNLDHDYPVYRSFLEPKVLGSALTLAALVALAAYLYARTARRATRPLDPAARLVAFGIAWFFVAISVESSVIPIVDVIYEHRVYLPSVGLFAAVATGGMLVARRFTPRPGRLALGVAATLAAVLAVATLARNRVWRDELTIWSDVVEKSPNKTRPHSNVGVALVAVGREREALEHFLAVVRIDPNHVSGYNNLAVQLSRFGRREEAEQYLEVALALKPDHAETYYNLGRMRLEEKRSAEAAALLERAVALDPNYGGAWANLGGALNQLGRPAETVRLLEQKDALLRDSAEARFNLGVAYALVGDAAGAQREVALLSRLAPDRAAQLAQYMRARGMQ